TVIPASTNARKWETTPRLDVAIGAGSPLSLRLAGVTGGGRLPPFPRRGLGLSRPARTGYDCAMARPLDGPRLEPRGGRVTALVALLHGYGANGDDLIALGEAWRQRLPEAAFVAPNAPNMIPGMYGALQWFPLTLRDPSEYWRGVVSAQPTLDRFLDAELSRYRVEPERLVLVGFSQGTMMALHAGLRRPRAPAGIVAYSGLLAGPEQLAGIRARPPVLLVHGEEDDL